MVAPSEIERVILKFRKALLDAETRATQQTLAAYADTRQALIDRIQAFTKTLESRPLTAGEEWRDERAKALLSQVETRMNELARTASPIITNGQADAVGLAEHQALGMAVISAANDPAIAEIVASSWNRLNTGAVESLIGRMSDGSPLNATLAGMGPDTSQRLRDALTDAVANGKNPRQVAAALEGQVDVSGARLMTIARTEVLTANRNASLASYAENADILSGWVWVADLAGACAGCAAMHGTEHPLSETFFEAHPACRCSPCPLVKDVPSPVTDDGQAFFESLSPEEQDARLGKAGGEAFRNGEVQLSDFVARREDPRWGASIQQGSLSAARDNAAAGNQEAEAA
jgi:SPP1 gp7 family putative phage head morphogenesis protein